MAATLAFIGAFGLAAAIAFAVTIMWPAMDCMYDGQLGTKSIAVCASIAVAAGIGAGSLAAFDVLHPSENNPDNYTCKLEPKS